MKLDEATLINTLVEYELAYKESIKKSLEYEHLYLTSSKHYKQAQVYKYIIEKLKEALK